MKITATVTDVLRNFSDYINRVAYRRERFVLLRGGKPVAELSPVPTGTRLGDLPGLLRALPSLSPEAAASFADDLDEARAELAGAGRTIGAHDLWLAAAAVAHDLTLVTANVREFEGVPGLSVEAW